MKRIAQAPPADRRYEVPQEGIFWPGSPDNVTAPLIRCLADALRRAANRPDEAVRLAMARAAGHVANKLVSDEPLLVLDELVDALTGADWPLPGDRLFLARNRLAEVQRALDSMRRTSESPLPALLRSEIAAWELSQAAGRLIAQAQSQATFRADDQKPLPQDECEHDDEVPEAMRAAPRVIASRLRTVRARFHEHICQGPRVIRSECAGTSSRVEVHVFDSVTYVRDTALRLLEVHLPSPDGVMEVSEEGWNVRSPLGKLQFIHHFLGTFPGIDWHPCTDEPDPALREWLWKMLGRDFINSGGTKAYIEAVRQALDVPAWLVDLGCFVSQGNTGPVDSRDCAALWKHETWWRRIRRESPNLMRLAWMARKAGVLKPAQNLDVLKADMIQRGAGQAGWAAMAREGRSHYALALDGAVFPDRALHRAAFLARVLAPFRADEVPPQPLQKALLQLEHIVRDVHDVHIPEPLIRLATAKYRELDPHKPVSPPRKPSQAEGWARLHQRKRRQEAFVEDEWISVAAWLHETRPRVRNQEWALGWEHLVRRMQRWKLRMEESVAEPEWLYPVQTHIGQAFIAFGLMSEAELRLDGVEMAHCVGDYADACRQGHALIYSIRQKADLRRVATAALAPAGDGRWDARELRGRANRPVDANIRSYVEALAEACGSAG